MGSNKIRHFFLIIEFLNIKLSKVVNMKYLKYHIVSHILAFNIIYSDIDYKSNQILHRFTNKGKSSCLK